MENVFLKNGQQAQLVNKLDNGKFLVEPYYEFQDYESREWHDITGNLQIVDAVYPKPPIEKISQDFIDVLDKIKSKTEQLSNIEKEVRDATTRLSKLKTDSDNLEKWQVDLSTLKSPLNIRTLKI